MSTPSLVLLLSGCAIFNLFGGKDDDTESTLPTTDADADIDADTDTDADADTHHHHDDTGTTDYTYDTGGDPGGGAWTPAGLLIYAGFGVNTSGDAVPVNLPNYGATYPSGYGPFYDVVVFGPDYLTGSDPNQFCEVQYVDDHPSQPNPPAGQWFEWTVGPGDGTLQIDTCGSQGVQYTGYDLSDLFGALEWDFAVGPLDPTIESYLVNYYDTSTMVGGSVGGDLLGYLTPLGIVQGLPVNNQMDVVDYYSFFQANQIPSNPGLRTGFYNMTPFYYVAM